MMHSSSNQDTDSTNTMAGTIVGFDTTARIKSQNPSSYLIKSNLTKIQTSPVPTVNQPAHSSVQLSSSSSAA
ncbi:unnamed protein product, partial [Rotaria socialis]